MLTDIFYCKFDSAEYVEAPHFLQYDDTTHKLKLYTLETDGLNHSEWLLHDCRMNGEKSPLAPSSNPLLFFYSVICLCLSWGLKVFFFIFFFTKHLLYFLCPDVQLYFLYHHVLIGTYLKSFNILYMLFALLSVLMTEVPSCPLSSSCIYCMTIDFFNADYPQVPLPRLWHVYSTWYCRLGV